MRRRRSSQKFRAEQEIFRTYPIDQVVRAFVERLTKSTTNDEKFDYLFSFLNKFKQIFSQSKPKLDASDADRAKFELDLLTNCEKICTLLAFYLCQTETSQIRLLSLRLVIYLSHLREFHIKLQYFNIKLLIIRLIDLDLNYDETALCLEYIRLLNDIYIDCIDKPIVYCLLSSIEDSSFRLNELLLETLLEIIIKNPKLACECNAFADLISYIQNGCTENEFNIELITQCLIKVADDHECRRIMRLDDLLSNLISPLIDIDYVPLIYGSMYSHHRAKTGKMNEKYDPASMPVDSSPKLDSILNSCTIALYSMMKQTIGIPMLTVNDCKLLKSLLSPCRWFLESNKHEKAPHKLFNQSTARLEATRKTSTDERKLVLITNLINLLYRLFKVEDISIQEYIGKISNMHNSDRPHSQSASTVNYPETMDLIDDELVNAECDFLFESTERYTNHRTVNPNLAICYNALLFKAFIEADIHESLLDLYFGLPVSFLQNYNLLLREQCSSNQMYQYQMLSLKCLNLFAELYYMGISLFYNEYCLDDFLNLDTTTQPPRNNARGTRPYSLDTSIYNEKKKNSLILYMKRLNFVEREKEIILYMTEFISKKERFKSGKSIQIKEISRLSFLSQNFIANSGYLSSKG